MAGKRLLYNGCWCPGNVRNTASSRLSSPALSSLRRTTTTLCPTSSGQSINYRHNPKSFFGNICPIRTKGVPLPHKNPPSLFTMLKSAGRFVCMKFEKRYANPTELLKILESRGLDCSSVAEAESKLRSVGYYRLTGYLFPFLSMPKSAHLFKPGSSLKQAFILYEFDRELRFLVFDQIERIEIAVRSAIVNITCSETDDVFWLTKPEYFANADKFAKTLALINKELQCSREDFITHFAQTYDDAYPPSWMVAEVIPLGVLTRVYENIASNRIRKKIAQHFGLNIPVFISWMTIVTLTRNTCCHHARLWNRCLSLRALTMSHHSTPWVSDNVRQGRVFFTLCILKHFVDNIFPQNVFRQSLISLLDKYPDVDTRAMGFPDNWKDEPLWRQLA